MQLMRILLAVAVFGCGSVVFAEEKDASSCHSASVWSTERKKVVSFGWEWSGATPDDLLRHAELIDKSGLDGIGFNVDAKGVDGKPGCCSAYVSDSTFVWTRDMFADQLPTLRKAMALRLG